MTEFILEEFVSLLEKKGIRYILIGGQAVIVYGSPVVSFDFDFWIDPAQKEDFLKLADSLDFEYGSKDKPLVIFYAGPEKLDIFFAKKMATVSGESISFQESYDHSLLLKDPTGFGIRVPVIDDLITLKRCKKKPSAKDVEDIEYLEIIKNKLKL